METLRPGGSVGRHRHPDHVLVAISDGRIASKSVHGRVETYGLEPGDSMWFQAGSDEIENIGTREWRAVIVEFRAAEGRQ